MITLMEVQHMSPSTRFPKRYVKRMVFFGCVFAGLICASTPAAADTITYTYDSLGRLATIYDATTGVTVTYTYDLNGNRLTQVTTTS